MIGFWGGVFLGMSVTLLALLGSSGSSELAPRATQPPAIEVVVLGKDSGKPLPGATVRFSIDFGTAIARADKNGSVRFDLSKRTFQDALSLDVWSEGYVQQRYAFAQNDIRYPKIPAKLSVELLPGEETLGGKVVDEQGRPVAGVTVTVWGRLGERKETHELAYMVDATTDQSGQWRCRCFRQMKFAHLYLSHPDYLSDDESHPREHGQPANHGNPAPNRPPVRQQPLEGLRDFSDVQVMTAGVSLAGMVTDENNKPIAGAEVGWLGWDWKHTFHAAMSVTRTRADGRFRFPHVPDEPLWIQVKANGHAPEFKALNELDRAGHLTMKLGRARAILARVVDTSGEPIPDAFLTVDAWRNSRALGVYLKTDADGRFRWDDAPADDFVLVVSRAGFAHERSDVLVRSTRFDVVLKRALFIWGTIKDAATDQPVEQTDVDVGVADAKTGDIDWTRDGNAFSFQCRLQANIDVEKRPELRLRVGSVGYEPAVSRVFRGEEKQIEYNVSLKRASNP
jgi:protocatechuate 3,4-dioxygenase beta subunit